MKPDIGQTASAAVRARARALLPLPAVLAGALLPAALSFAFAACGRTSGSSADAGGFPDSSPTGIVDAVTLREAAPYDAHIVPVDSGHPPPGHFDVLMQHDDVSRTGQNLSETVLTPSNVNVDTFGKLFSLPVDGLMYAQPLIVTNTQIADAGAHDVVIAATMHNSVYAFDANAPGPPLWHVNLGPSIPNTLIGPIVASTGMPTGTTNIQVEIGILSTPVIDREHGYIYVAHSDFTNSVQSVKLHVLSLATGKDLPGSPVTINAQVHGTGQGASDAGIITFNPEYQLQRPGLALLNGTVYLAFSSNKDLAPYSGWVLGYTYSAAAKTLTQTQVFNTAPDGDRGGIWMGGQGIITDGQSLYLMVANGSVTAQSGGQSYGESFLKLSPALEVEDWFIPYNYAYLTNGDWDLGSGGPVLIPGTSPPLLVGGGKQGVLYVVDTTNMGHMGTVDNMATQAFEVADGGYDIGPIYGAPVIWTGTPVPRLFLWAVGDIVKAYDLKNGLFGPPILGPLEIRNFGSYQQNQMGAFAVSSNGAQNGIFWSTKPLANPNMKTVPGALYAFDATTLTELWDSTQNASRDGVGDFSKFNPPTVANGKVYLASGALPGAGSSGVTVYGLLPDVDDGG